METYKIIGGDGREYGPATLDELKEWVAEGRVGRETLVWRSEIGAWTPAILVPEIGAELAELYQKNAPVAQLQNVGFWPRMAAYLMDQAVLVSLLLLTWPLAARLFHLQPIPMHEITTAQDFKKQLDDFCAVVMPVLVSLNFVYYVLFNGLFGATPGKMTIGARIVRVDGTRIGFGIALLRWIGERISDSVFGIGYLFVAFRADRRALHDLLAGTQVVYRNRS